ncbi:MAG TPA: hypothetical protein PK573_02545 [Spirochaetota bacterium]|nr:hypothetical protein [Spirochaetota bacterium]
MKSNKLSLIYLAAALALSFCCLPLLAAEESGVNQASAASDAPVVNKPEESGGDRPQNAPSVSEKKEEKTATVDELIKRKIDEKKADDAAKGKTPQCLLNPRKIHVTGYFAPLVRMGERNGHFAAFAGAKGGVMLDDFVIGAGYSIFTDYTKAIANGHNHKILTQFGGLLLEYEFFRKYIVNFSVGAIVGAGTSGYVYRKRLDDDDDDRYDDDDYEYRYKGTAFFYLEPEIMFYVNLARFCRLGVGVSYRYTNGLDKYGLTDRTFDGLHGIMLCQFGWF